MASTEAIHVQRLEAFNTQAQAQLQQLVVDSHWNQLAADWTLFFSLGTLYVVRDGDGVIVGSGAVLPMGPSLGDAAPVSWISMILVSPKQRGHGLGRAVFARCLAQVTAEGRVPMLDATPEGEALYVQFGFEPTWGFTRWRRPPRERVMAHCPADDSTEHLLQLDSQALGFDRRALLGGIASREGARCVHHADASALLRQGRTAVHIGPMHATEEADGAALLHAVAAAVSDVLVVDVPKGHCLMEAALKADGFIPERSFVRMVLSKGLKLPPTKTEIVQAVAGPEYA